MKVSGIKLSVFIFCWLVFGVLSYAQEVKEPNVAGSFYPDSPQELSQMLDNFIDSANPQAEEGRIFALISPHAGYGFSGGIAALGYKLIKDKPYKIIIVIGPSHYYSFSGVSIYPEGAFRTPLGDLEIDKEFTQRLLYKDKDIFFEPGAFEKEHSVEVQLPFLQKVLSNGSTTLTISTERSRSANPKIVPIVMGDCTLATCQKLADLLKEAIGNRQDVLVVASTDMYHGYDYEESEIVDNLTLSYLKNMDAQGLYNGLREGKLQLCGGFPVVSTLILAKELGHNKLKVLQHTNSSEVTGKKIKGIWTVGYASCLIDQEKGEISMLSKEQRKKLLAIARNSIQTYLKIGKKLELTETDPILLKEMGAFVTLHKHGELRGCIGNLIGQQPLYLTVRDMAVEAAVDDPRFPPLILSELKDIEIELSVLSPLKRIESADEIKMGIHGVLLRHGFNSGVFLPQVATETGWSKEEFLSNLCSHKAGLPALAWKDKSTEIYIFTAEVFSEKEIQAGE
ncbi:MAG: AmmeMemoRadiSam system protein B [Candidatus Omnitrophota bacterium]|nr:AmmeMemoRadiSam system protein B [Candidatus Omnitrophota bacterium]